MAEGIESKKPFAISNLMSPPELQPFETFTPSTKTQCTGIAKSELRMAAGPNPPLSPPISPLVKNGNVDHAFSPASSASPSVNDPILYPTRDISPPHQPLFAQDESHETRQLVEQHVTTRPTALFREASPPRPEDYELMLFFQSQVIKKYRENPKGWLQRERAQLLADRKAGARYSQVKLPPIFPAKPQPIRAHAQRVIKVQRALPRQAPAPVSVHRAIHTTSPQSAPQRQTAIRRVSATTPDPATRRIAAPSREDKDFESLPDYCPPLDSLPPKANSLKVDWKGAPIDLSSDPHRHLVHPDELSLAANLRLDAATYLTSKRRMFIARLNCLRIGKEFRKTDAQQACKIDVNKASKLWTAFEKVGWLDKHWVARWAQTS